MKRRPLLLMSESNRSLFITNDIAFKNEAKFTTEHYTPLPTQPPYGWQHTAVVETDSKKQKHQYVTG